MKESAYENKLCTDNNRMLLKVGRKLHRQIDYKALKGMTI